VDAGRIAHGRAVEVVTIAAAIGYYVLGGRGGDLAAIIGRRADERQESIRVRARSLAAQVAGLAALIGYVIELARGSAVWPFELFVAVLAGSFLAGLVIYRRAAPAQPTAQTASTRHDPTSSADLSPGT
jgi:hypothetical protein